MTIALQNMPVRAVATALQTVFNFAFRVDDSSTLQVYVADILQPGGNYTVNLNADQSASPGGTVTFAVGRSAGDLVTMERSSPDTQANHFSAYGPFPASAVERALDIVTMLTQEIFGLLGRMFRVKRSNFSRITSFDLPDPVQGEALGWVSSDGGLTFHLDNVGVGVIGVVPPGTLVKNEVPVGNVNSTTGSDGNGVFTFAHAPVSQALFDLLVDGVRVNPTFYARTGQVATFNAGKFPITGSDIRADYFW